MITKIEEGGEAPPKDNTVLDRYMALFAGLKRGYGSYTLPAGVKPTEKGKKEGQAVTERKPLTDELYEQHLTTTWTLGVVPIRDDGTCLFGAIDIDDYKTLNHKKVVADIQQLRLPLVACKSKSGGLHLYVFFTDAAPCNEVRKTLETWGNALGFPNVEIFPKQDSLLPDEVGNWINLPYQGALRPEGYGSERFGYDDSGAPISELDKWLDYAESKKISAAKFAKIKPAKSAPVEPVPDEEPPQVWDTTSDAPPCIDSFRANKVTESRNNALFGMAVYAKKKYGEDFAAHVHEDNAAYMDPPLEKAEVDSIIKSVRRRDFFYRCKEQPCKAVCQKALCSMRKFGIGGAHSTARRVFRESGISAAVTASAFARPAGVVAGVVDAACMAFAGGRGIQPERFVALMRELPPDMELGAAAEALSDEELLAAYERAVQAVTPEYVREVNSRFAVVSVNGKNAVAHFDIRGELKFQVPKEFCAASAEQVVDHIKKDGGVVYAKLNAKWWDSPQRRQYGTPVLDPQLPPRSRAPCGGINTWTGLRGTPNPHAGWQLMEAHIREKFCDGGAEEYEFFLDLLARKLQYPWEQPGVVPAVVGPQGSGKGIVLGPRTGYLSFWGPHGLQILRKDHWAGKHNAILMQALVLYLDEALYAKDPEAAAFMRGFTTEQHLLIEPKFIDKFTIENRLLVMISTNNEHAVPAAEGERRYFMLRMRQTDHSADPKYFRPLIAELEAGGRERFLHELLTRDVSKYAEKRMPRTDATAEQQAMSLSLPLRWWLECLKDGTYSADWQFKTWGVVATDYLWEAFQKFCGGRTGDWNKASFGKELNRALLHGAPQQKGKKSVSLRTYNVPHYKLGQQKRWSIENGERVELPDQCNPQAPAKRIPDLDICRQRFCALLGGRWLSYRWARPADAVGEVPQVDDEPPPEERDRHDGSF